MLTLQQMAEVAPEIAAGGMTYSDFAAAMHKRYGGENRLKSAEGIRYALAVAKTIEMKGTTVAPA